jgi:hypothetical protein
MKKIILLSIFIVMSLWFNNYTHADDTKKVKVKVTERMPWMECWDKDVGKDPKNPVYECYVESGFWSVQKMIAGIIKYFTFIAGIAGVLFLVINGVMYSMGWMDPWMKDEAKKRISKTLVWLILLFCSWILLNIIAPWIYK